MVLDDQRVQLDHFIVVVQHGNGQLTGDVGRKRSDVGEERLFRHFDDDAPAMARLLYASVPTLLSLSLRVLFTGYGVEIKLKGRGNASCAGAGKTEWASRMSIRGAQFGR